MMMLVMMTEWRHIPGQYEGLLFANVVYYDDNQITLKPVLNTPKTYIKTIYKTENL